MAQDSSSDLPSDDLPQSQTSSSSSDPSLSRNLSLSRLNAKAPEFVPRSSSSSSSTDPTQPPPILYHQPPQLNHGSGFFHAQAIQGHVRIPVQNHRPYAYHVPVHFHHHHQHQQQQKQQQQQLQLGQGQKQGAVDSDHVNKNGLTEEATQKIINQVEYYFSDVNLATTDHLMRFINKDPEGYVPLSVVSSFKKINALISSNSQLASILRNSAKLAVSEDGKKVRRQLPLTESDMEELQSRIVVAENLPEDHCHQNLMKVFSAVGSVKSIRTCQPQTSNGGASSGSRTAKTDGMHYSNKLHAFVEYESVELAEKAVAELNEEDNWRNDLRVRLLHKRTKKSAQARVKKVGHEGEAHLKEDDTSTSEQQEPNEKHLEDPSQQYETQPNQVHEHGAEEQANDKEGSQKKGRSRGRGKGRGRPQYHQNHNHNHNHRGNHVGTPRSVHPVNSEHPIVSKQPPGPRMPDGTKGFSMGRGKPVAVNIG